MTRSALVVGVSGVIGNALARHLAQQGWTVNGLARHPSRDIEGVQAIHADLLDPADLREALEILRPTHIFFTTWMRQPTEAENIKINAAMVRNLLKLLPPPTSVASAKRMPAASLAAMSNRPLPR